MAFTIALIILRNQHGDASKPKAEAKGVNTHQAALFASDLDFKDLQGVDDIIATTTTTTTITTTTTMIMVGGIKLDTQHSSWKLNAAGSEVHNFESCAVLLHSCAVLLHSPQAWRKANVQPHTVAVLN